MPLKRKQPIHGANGSHRAIQQRAATNDATQQTRAPADKDPLAYAPDSQAKRIILRFGGVQNLLRAMAQAGIRRTAPSVYHWISEGGLIPPRGIRDVMIAERQLGLTLTDADWSPYIRVEGVEPLNPPDPTIQTPQTTPVLASGGQEIAIPETTSAPRRFVL